MRSRLVSLIAALGLIMTFMPSATAGGWATAAVIDDVDSITVGEPFTIRYVVRAHGIVGQELGGMETSLKFANRETSQVVESFGKATADPKVYESTVTLPTSGDWKWKVVIHNYLPDQAIESPMPTLMASAPGATPGESVARVSGMTTVVTILDGGFSPATLEVRAGDTITWVNEGQMPHQVASDVLGFETSPMIQPGEAFFQTMIEPGTFEYLCPPHPHMLGTVVVR
jgi:plastocyanin